MNTYYCHSLGCKVNSYETSLITTELDKEGYKKVDDASKANIIILNTCSVTGTA
ncbi:MAG TPA: tRNA (N(6)-L-threonylcarbamoyladenosine(37)-C(2))-methylthiotransferase MtaB, partial [Firmicutes bacterium]|nr:tRNA (N(6)-L-threonylcarbamoyladenosine(37)-C(2))-methylthiotransferase MtaB [Bacillota bacterium]